MLWTLPSDPMASSITELLRQHRVLVLKYLIHRIKHPESEDMAIRHTIQGIGRHYSPQCRKAVLSLWKALAPDMEVLADLPPQELRHQLGMRYNQQLPKPC